MHPAHKMTYFCNQKWEPEWIDCCYTIIHEIWNKHYKPLLVTHAPMKQVRVYLINSYPHTHVSY